MRVFPGGGTAKSRRAKERRNADQLAAFLALDSQGRGRVLLDRLRRQHSFLPSTWLLAHRAKVRRDARTMRLLRAFAPVATTIQTHPGRVHFTEPPYRPSDWPQL